MEIKVEVTVNLGAETLSTLKALIGAKMAPVAAELKGSANTNAADKKATAGKQGAVADEKAAKVETTDTTPAETADPAPVDTTTYTEDDVRAVFAEAKHRLGSSDACRKILTDLGVRKVSDLKPEQYATAIAKAKAL